MPPRPATLGAALRQAGVPAASRISDGRAEIALAAAVEGCGLADAGRFAGRSVLLSVASQFEAALALLALDGLASRIVLAPPDLKPEYLADVVRDAAADAIVCSDPGPFAGLGIALIATLAPDLSHRAPDVTTPRATEWLLLTSGTTGTPKIAVHTLAGLAGAIPAPQPFATRALWSTFYDIRRYGGLQIFLRAMFCGGSLILSRPDESVADALARLAAEGVTHISGTPTHWRRALMSAALARFRPGYVRLSGEIADQAVLDALKAAFPQAAIGHAYASTEAGVGFEVNDGLEGFPATYLDEPRNGVELKVVDGALRLRSGRMASAYAGRPDLELVGADGFVDTGDMVERRGSRCHFTGRRGGIINVGGLKVHPEEIEAVINRHAAVELSRVKARKSPIIGAIVVADVVLKASAARDGDSVRAAILALCRESLPPHKIPALVNVVAALETTAGGKLARADA